ncbi:protein FAM102B isoform X2 [Coregonus clupeaformis]|uniref:protein FAM102B isoform X2 n=1 Tax=Coregonus clupeaformis TaxID=59861 RepID=UPI001E1C371A|nr:protein FAM102B isoform X2 [Coregonus clupeaformis]
MEASRRLAALLHTRTVLGKHFWTHNFSVSLLLDELGNVPRVTGLIFCKVRLLDGSFTEESPRLEVLHNSVQWGKMFEFECRIAVNSLSGVLDDCMCRLSVRKDTKGGKSYQKVGYADLNLSEYAGSGYVTRHCLLEGYMNKDNKLDNSLLKVGLQMQLLQGDPCFRVPTHHSLPNGTLSSENVEQPRESTSSHSEPEDTLRRQLAMKGGLLLDSMPSQNPEAQERARVAGQLTRVGNTRVDAKDVVENLCLESLGSVFELPAPMEEAGLALFVGQDGTTTLGVTHIQNRDSHAGSLENVIIMK